MNITKSLLLVLAFFVVSNNFAQSEQNAPKSCTDCHSALLNKKLVHAPVSETCENCHMSNDNAHPQEGVKGFQLADEPAALCFYCHEEFTTGKKHAPAESGECLMCHDPHSSDNQALLSSAKSQTLCSQCHDFEIPETDIAHSPVKKGACHECHDPHQSNEYAFLKAAKPELCFSCHKNVASLTEASVKHAVFEDDCLNCHQPHSAPAKGLLMEATPTLCFNCHSDVQEQLDTAKVVHKVMSDEMACSNCHSPHASNHSAMLIKASNDLCLGCHKRTYTTEAGKTQNIAIKLKEGNMVHAPVEDACSNCHQPHVSEYASLLTNYFPEKSYAQAKIDNYALCFDCHDSELLTAENSTATNFRHGDSNMHFLHLKGDKGKSCTMCHDVHGAKNAHLIREKVPFGNWQMDMNYKLSENGGSCATGCHAEKVYDRTHVISEEKLIELEEKKTTTGRYQTYEIEYHEVDSSVILANLELEKQRRIQDSINQILIAQRIQDSIAKVQSDSTQLLAEVDSVIESEVEPVLAVADNLNENESIDEQKEPVVEIRDSARVPDSDLIKPKEVFTDSSLTDDSEIIPTTDPVAEVATINDSTIDVELIQEPVKEDLVLNERPLNEQIEKDRLQQPIVSEQTSVEQELDVEKDLASAENPEQMIDTNISKPVMTDQKVAEEPQAFVEEDPHVEEDNQESIDEVIDKQELAAVQEVEQKSETHSLVEHKNKFVKDEFEFPEISFGFSSSEIGQEMFKVEKVSNWLKVNSTKKLKIIGYTDSIGSEEYNYYLSLQRAENVRNAIVEEGVHRKRLKIEAKGEKNPAKSNKTPDGRKQNRRVEFILIKEE